MRFEVRKQMIEDPPGRYRGPHGADDRGFERIRDYVRREDGFTLYHETADSFLLIYDGTVPEFVEAIGGKIPLGISVKVDMSSYPVPERKPWELDDIRDLTGPDDD